MSGFHVEDAERPRRRLAMPRLGLVLVAIGAVASFLILCMTPSTAEPARSRQTSLRKGINVTWSENPLEIVLSPGDSASRTLSVTSDRDVDDARLRVSPILTPFVKICGVEERRADGVVKDRHNRGEKQECDDEIELDGREPRPVVLTFSIPASANFGTYDGSIEIRSEREQLSQALRVRLRIANPFGVSIREITSEASTILLAQVISIQSNFVNAGADIVTEVTLAPKTAYKGSLPQDPITIRVAGGTVGNTSILITGAPSFTRGEYTLLLLDGPNIPNEYVLHFDALGTFHVDNDPVLGLVAIIDPAYRQTESIRRREPTYRALLKESEQRLLPLSELLIAMGISI